MSGDNMDGDHPYVRAMNLAIQLARHWEVLRSEKTWVLSNFVFERNKIIEYGTITEGLSPPSDIEVYNSVFNNCDLTLIDVFINIAHRAEGIHR